MTIDKRAEMSIIKIKTVCTACKRGANVLELRNVKKSFSDGRMRIDAVKGVDLCFPERGLFFLVGKSGSGKSTLLNLLGGLEKPTSGEVVYEGRALSSMSSRELDEYRARTVSFVFQEKNVFPALTVAENITFSDASAHPQKTLEELGIGGLLERKVNELSGGQLQRVAIARALVRGCRVLLADEPTGNLDRETSRELFSLLKQLSRDRLVIDVTHDRESAEAFGDVVITLKSGRVDEIKRREAASEGEPAEVRPAQSEAPRAVGRKGRRTYAGKTAVAAFFGRKAKCIVSVILSVLVLLCMEIVLTAQGGTDAEVEARFLESHPDTYSYAYLKIGQKPPLSVSQMVREVLPEEEDALLVNGIGIQARSLEQLNSFGFSTEGCAPLEEDVFYVNAGNWGTGRKLDEEVWGRTERHESDPEREFYDCVLIDGEEVPFLESGLSVEQCVGMQFRLYATFLYEAFSPDEVPTLTLGGIVKDAFTGSRYDTHFPLLYANHDFVFSEGCYETIWAIHSALVPVDGDLMQSVRALSEADLLLKSEHGAERFYAVSDGGDWVITFPRVDDTLYDLVSYMWIASALLGVIYFVLILQLITATIREKKSEIALMRALGLTKGQVFAAYFKAVCLFTLPSVLLAWLLMPAVVGVLNLIFAVEFMGSLVYPVFVTFLPFVYIGVFGIAAALLGFLAAVLLLARIPLAAAMRKEV